MRSRVGTREVKCDFEFQVPALRGLESTRMIASALQRRRHLTSHHQLQPEVVKLVR